MTLVWEILNWDTLVALKAYQLKHYELKPAAWPGQISQIL